MTGSARDDLLPRAADFKLRLGEVVLVAAGLDGGERETYLREVGATDPDLAAEARRRIAAAEELTGSFLDTPAAARLDGGAADSPEPSPGAALPAAERYELGECLGVGGMGRVVKAFDRQLGRSVALKFLTHDDPEILRLFLREARSQARIQHPHVLEIYDSGEWDGQPFIAMRHVAGGTLAEVGASLSLEHKVRLLVQVAEGLHAAHRQGLLHRDVKPSNVLVEETPDGELVALVSDFGLASELEDAEAMAAEAVAGSPHYIAPERLAGLSASGSPTVIDRRSDVYSLGITLYRLLTGELPFTGQNTVDVLRRVVDQDLPPPRQRMPSLPVELEAIILRSVARDPDQRYASARAVAADIQRYLDGEVVEAYAAGLAYRLTRFVLRNKVLVGVAGMAAVLLLVAAVAVAVFALRADAARERAELRQGQAEELIRFMVVDLREKLESLGRLDVLDAASSEAMEYFAAVPEDELSEAELLRRSRMLYQIGDVRIREGDLAGAAAPMMESLALARRLAELRPDDSERLFELGQSHYWVGFVRWEQGDLAAAREPFEAYLGIARRLVGKDPHNRDWQRELSYAHSNLGALFKAQGEFEEAFEQFQANLDLDEKLVAADPDHADARSELAASHNTVGAVLQDLGQLREAGEHFVADLAIRQALVAAEPENFRLRERLGASLGHLGTHFLMQGQLALAGEHFEKMREIFEELLAHDRANTAWSYQLAWSHLDLGMIAYARGALEAANTSWRLQLRMIDQLLALDSTPHKWRRTRGITLYHLALLQKSRGDPAARSTVAGALDILAALAVARPTDRSVHRWLSKSWLLAGRLEDSPVAAKTAFERAAEVIEPLARDARDGRVLAPWAAVLSCLGRHDEARTVIETLHALGYSEPGLVGFCQITERVEQEESRAQMSQMGGALR